MTRQAPATLSIVRNDAAPPSLEALRSSQSATSKLAWATAYPLLHTAGHAIARMALVGSQHASERDDLVLTALEQLIQGIIENKEESYNGMDGWDDVLGMMRTIVRRRITDFLRQQERRPLDYVETLPEIALSSLADHLPFTPAELWAAVEELDPPLPELFSERFVEGWNTTEIAARRNINANTLLTHFAKGFRTLKAKLTTLTGEATPRL